MDRAKRRLSQASLPSLVDIASPGAFSAITDTDATATITTVTVTTAASKKKRKRKSKTRRTVVQRTNDQCETQKVKKKEDESYFQAVEEYKAQLLLPKKERTSARKIVDEINKHSKKRSTVIKLFKKNLIYFIHD